MNVSVICLFLLILFVLSSHIIIRYYIFFKYKDVITLFELFLDKSYDLTYQNSLITYLSDGIKNLPADEKESIERDFVKQTLLLLGPSNTYIINRFFGNQEYAINYMITYIRKRIANDGLAEVVKKADENK